MKGVIVKEIVALLMKPSTAGGGMTTVEADKHQKSNIHIRFADGDEKPKPKPKDPTTDKGNPHAKYYAAVTFNQIVLTPADRDVSLALLNVYFEMFKEILGTGGVDEDNQGNEEVVEKEAGKENEKRLDRRGRISEGRKAGRQTKGSQVTGAAGFAEVEDSDSKLVSAILTGVNRALPFAKIGAGDVE